MSTSSFMAMAASAGRRGKGLNSTTELEYQSDNSQDVDDMADQISQQTTKAEEELSVTEGHSVTLLSLESQNKESADQPLEPSVLMVKMYDSIQAMRHEMNQMCLKLDSALDDIGTQKRKVENLEEKSVSLEIKLERANNEIISLKHKNDSLNKRVVQLDSYTRRSNLIFRGVKQAKEENCNAQIKKILQETLELQNVENIQFERCHRLNTMTKPQPIICRFNWYQDRQNVWQSRSKLKGGDISLSEDFPKEILECRKSLYPVMKRAKSSGHVAYLAADKLIIDDKTYTVSNLHTLPQDLDPAKLATRKVGNVTGFFSKSSPLSNFFEAQFEIDNKTFCSTEQYLQYCKAEYAELYDFAGKIHSTKSALECKKMGDSIRIDASKWLPVAKEVLARGCLAKFKQNDRAKYFLLSTENSILAEATKDKYWGTGLTLDSDIIGDPKLWPGQNTFGQILGAVRERIRDSINNE